MPIFCIPRDLNDGSGLYQPLPEDHFSVNNALDVMSYIADHIERTIGVKEPYEISLLGSEPALQPVLKIGTARSERIEKVLASLDIPLIIHLSSHYPTSFSNGFDRNPRPEQDASQQQSLPSIGASCGLLSDNRHSVTLGSYLRLSSAPKKIHALTAPFNIDPSVLVTNSSIVTQPSVADRNYLYNSEDKAWKEVLSRDQNQAVAVAARQEALRQSFELARTVASVSGLQSDSKSLPATQDRFYDTVWDGSQPMKKSSSQWLAHASDNWAILEITRQSAIASFPSAKKRWQLKSHPPPPPQIQSPVPGLIVSKRGRTTGFTIGTINGAKSLYRLPRDGGGVRRYDYSVVSSPWGGVFSSPGDAGAVILAQRKEDIENNQVTRSGEPCALIVASSTSGHVSFIQDMQSVMESVKSKGLGDITFIDVPRQQ